MAQVKETSLETATQQDLINFMNYELLAQMSKEQLTLLINELLMDTRALEFMLPAFLSKPKNHSLHLV